MGEVRKLNLKFEEFRKIKRKIKSNEKLEKMYWPLSVFKKKGGNFPLGNGWAEGGNTKNRHCPSIDGKHNYTHKRCLQMAHFVSKSGSGTIHFLKVQLSGLTPFFFENLVACVVTQGCTTLAYVFFCYHMRA